MNETNITISHSSDKNFIFDNFNPKSNITQETTKSVISCTNKTLENELKEGKVIFRNIDVFFDNFMNFELIKKMNIGKNEYFIFFSEPIRFKL